MATIQNQDNMAMAISSVSSSLSVCISSFTALRSVSAHAMDVGSIVAARMEFTRVETTMSRVEQSIRTTSDAQQKLGNGMKDTASGLEGFVGKLKSLASLKDSMKNLKQVMDLSDAFTQTTARLNSMNDGMQSTAQLQDMVFASAERSRGSYLDMAASVTRMGSQAAGAFSGNAELIAFSEQLNKNFAIAGTSQEGIAEATQELTQGMARGALSGAELNSVFQNARPVAQRIADYLQVDVGQLQAMAEEGQITADVIKGALLSSADETNRTFEAMPQTFGQIWTSVQNHGVRAFGPVLQKINEITGNDTFNAFVNGAINGMYILSNEIQYLMDQSKRLFSFIAGNWSFIEPIIWGVIAAYAVYNASALIAAVRTAYDTVVKYAHVAASWAETAAIVALEAAQFGLNAAIAMCPITWIIMAIIALIVIFYLAVAAINEFAGTSLSATGIIVGVFFAAGAIIGNVVIMLVNLMIDCFAIIWNRIASFAEFFANVFNDPAGSIVRLFADMADSVLGILSAIASAIDTLFGSHLADTVEGWRKTLKDTVKATFGDAVVKIMKIDSMSLHMQPISVGKLYDKGYDFGSTLAPKAKSFLTLNIPEPQKDPADPRNPGNRDAWRNPSVDLGRTGNDIAETAANTGSMKDSLDVSSEDLKYLRDTAEMEAINRFTTAEINVSMNNQNHLNSDVDLDGMVTYLTDSLIETVQTAAEKVHR